MSKKWYSTSLKKGNRANGYTKNLAGPKEKLINVFIGKITTVLSLMIIR